MNLEVTSVLYFFILAVFFGTVVFFILFIRKELEKRNAKKTQIYNLKEIQSLIQKQLEAYSKIGRQDHLLRNKNTCFILIYRTLLFLELDLSNRRYPPGQYRDYLLYLLDNVMRKKKEDLTSDDMEVFDKANKLIISFIANY